MNDETNTDLVKITVDWYENNERRAELIYKNVYGIISRQESIELAELQRLALCRRRLLAPLPIKELEEIKKLLDKKE